MGIRNVSTNHVHWCLVGEIDFAYFFKEFSNLIKKLMYMSIPSMPISVATVQIFKMIKTFNTLGAIRIFEILKMTRNLQNGKSLKIDNSRFYSLF